MYGWIWRKLPGKWPVKALESIALVAVISAVLVVVVFPWVEPKLPFSGNTVSGETEGGDVPSQAPTNTRSPAPTDVPSQTGGTGGDVLPGD